MAICFDMQISFLDENFDIDEFTSLLEKKVKPYRNIDFHPLHNTFVMADGPYLKQFNIIPKNVGFAVSFDDASKKHSLDDKQCLDLSLHMYNFIKGLPSYQMALVGWETGFLSNYLERDNNDVIIEIAEIEGLVVSNALLSNVKETGNWELFDQGHMWIPCESAIGNIMAG